MLFIDHVELRLLLTRLRYTVIQPCGIIGEGTPCIRYFACCQDVTIGINRKHEFMPTLRIMRISLIIVNHAFQIIGQENSVHIVSFGL